MPENLTSLKEARESILSCAAFLADTIASAAGRAAAMESLIPYFVVKEEVDVAAELANSIEDPFTRDRLLGDIAAKCAALDDDDYAAQLIEAMDEEATRNSAQEKISVEKARGGQFGVALENARNLVHPSGALGQIAVFQARGGLEQDSAETLEEIDFLSARVNARREIADYYLRNGEPTKGISMLDLAANDAAEIEFAEDRIRALVAIASEYIGTDQSAKAVEILAKANESVDEVLGVHEDDLRVTIAITYLNAGSITAADETLDLVTDSTQLAFCLVGFGQVYRMQGETDDAIEALDESLAIIKSQREKEIRSTENRFAIMGSIAIEFARLGDFERALEIVDEILLPDRKEFCEREILGIAVESGNNSIAEEMLGEIEDGVQKCVALITMSDAYFRLGEFEKASEMLSQVDAIQESIPQFIARVEIALRLVERFADENETGKARIKASEILPLIALIPGTTNRATALAELSQLYYQYDFAISEDDKNLLTNFTQRAAAG